MNKNIKKEVSNLSMIEKPNVEKPNGMSDRTWKKFHEFLARMNIKYRDEIAAKRAAKQADQQKTS